MLASDQANLKDVEAVLAKSAEQAQRAGRIVRRIYEFVRRSVPKSESCDVVQLVDEVIGLVEPDARRLGIRVRRSVAAELPPVRGDRVLLGQAILNLVRNAIDAMRDVDAEQRQLVVAVTDDDDQLHLSIADRGSGIAPEALPHLFEPFFTTKTEGMGMGLNICRSVVEAHKGRLWVAANPQGGSIFHLLLPTTRP
jgi:signal transduction histidine kinase